MTEQARHQRKIMQQISVLLVVMIVILALTAIASAAAAWISIARTITSTVTIQQTAVELYPQQHCAGEDLTLTYRIQTTKVPSIVEIYDNWYDDDLGYNVNLEALPMFSIVSTSEDFTRTIQIPIPKLEPGMYHYVRAAQEDGSPISVMTVPVKIVYCP